MMLAILARVGSEPTTSTFGESGCFGSSLIMWTSIRNGAWTGHSRKSTATSPCCDVQPYCTSITGPRHFGCRPCCAVLGQLLWPEVLDFVSMLQKLFFSPSLAAFEATYVCVKSTPKKVHFRLASGEKGIFKAHTSICFAKPFG